jgi:exodeoxyribonuclease V gamma subunit
MRPMRAIPFKVVCMIGMNDDVFPGEQVKNLFDLLTKYPRPEDRNNVESNRYFFLESLISAQMKLIISYNAKSVRDSSDNLFSSPVKLLKDYLDEKKSGFKEIIQPLQPFSAKYFEENDGLFTFSGSNYKTAYALAQEFNENADAQILKMNNNELLDIELDDLIGFFMNPARTFFRKRLGVTFPYIQEKVEDNELFSIDALDAYHFKNEFLKVVEDGGSATDFRKKMHGEGKIPHGPAGKILLNGSIADVAGFIEKIRDHKGAGEPREVEVDNTFSVRENTIRVRGVLESVYGKWQVFFRPTKKAKQKDKLRIWIKHLFLNMVKQQDTCFLGTEEDVFLHPVSEPEIIIQDLLDIYLLGMERPLPMTPFIVLEMFDAKGDDPFAVMLEKRANPWGGETDDHAFSVAAELSGFYEERPETVKMLEDIADRIGFNYKRHETVIK